MSWFKKILGSLYAFNSQSSSQGSSQNSSQEPKFHYTQQKNETDGNDTEIENLTISETEDTTQSTQDSCYSWSSVVKKLGLKARKEN